MARVPTRGRTRAYRGWLCRTCTAKLLAATWPPRCRWDIDAVREAERAWSSRKAPTEQVPIVSTWGTCRGCGAGAYSRLVARQPTLRTRHAMRRNRGRLCLACLTQVVHAGDDQVWDLGAAARTLQVWTAGLHSTGLKGRPQT